MFELSRWKMKRFRFTSMTSVGEAICDPHPQAMVQADCALEVLGRGVAGKP